MGRCCKTLSGNIQERGEVMTVLGLTGSLGVGKTTIANFFADCGAHVIDTDAMVHDLLKSGSCYRKVAASFPEAVFDKKIDRNVLAEIVFKRPRKLALLENILHPAVRKEVRKKLRALASDELAVKMVVVDVPLLFEAGFEDLFDVVAVVRANQSLQVDRLKKDCQMRRKDIMDRIHQQMPQSEKLKRADFIIDNRYTKAGSRAQVEKIWDGLVIK